MARKTEELQSTWYQRLFEKFPAQNREKRHSILQWLLNHESANPETLSRNELADVDRRVDYRYRMLCQRYLEVEPTQGYRQLIARLSALMLGFAPIQSWAKQHPNARKAIATSIQQTIQELLEQDTDLQRQVSWIERCTQDCQLREALVLASVEEYCLQLHHNQPLLLDRLRQYLSRQHLSASRRVALTSAQQCA